LSALGVCARNSAAVSLGALALLHALWATGSAWPAKDRAQLADAIGGFAEFPGAGACLVVATLLAIASASVAGLPRSMPHAARAASAMTALVLFARGSAGLSGKMPQARHSRAFAELDRRVYSPICLILAALAVAGVAEA
jgi:hypothetical protein